MVSAENAVEPPRPSVAEVGDELAAHVRALAGPDAVPRPEQIAAVEAVVANRQRTLLVARTGFGKSAVYFSATRMLRDRGWGPTVVVSPLLALMRDQVAAAERLGLAAETINSSNLDRWGEIESRINADEIDLLLISPERLANQGFRERVFDALIGQAFALVCDEAHCISDWGHDFRPDYLRLRELIAGLPAWTPVLATTATANARVTADVAAQLGDDTLVLRTSLDRASLHLSVVDLATDAERLAWLAEALPELEGSGIIYCLTVAQAEVTAAWLRERGYPVAAYTGATEAEHRPALEAGLRGNELKALVATSALGMGFDKGDLAFCVHLGLPPSPVAYYQQVGRAGRAIDRAAVIAVPRPVEDAAVWRWFEQVSLPPESTCREVLDQLHATTPTSIAVLETSVNLGRTRLNTLLSILDVAGAVERTKGGWILGRPWSYDHDKAERLRALRRVESDEMLAFGALDGCRLRYLRERLDDAEAADCGRCDRCRGEVVETVLNPALVAAAQTLLRGEDVIVEPRRQWPTGLDEPKGKIGPPDRAEPGRALCRLGDGGWDSVVTALMAAEEAGETSLELSEEFLRSIAGVLKRWPWEARPTWICPVPSRRRPLLLDRVCTHLGALGKLPVHPALTRVDDARGWQADQANSAHQVANVWGAFAVDAAALPAPALASGPVLLIDDEIDSRWTMTVAAHLLRAAGTGAVLPFALRTR